MALTLGTYAISLRCDAQIARLVASFQQEARSLQQLDE